MLTVCLASFLEVNKIFELIILDPAVWDNELGLCRPFLLDPCDPGLQQRNTYGAGYLSNCHIRPHHAAARGSQDH